MRLLNWRVAVVAAALALTGTASAQDQSVPANRGYVMSIPSVEQPGNVYKHNGPCVTCVRSSVIQASGNYWCSSCANGANCNNGAGSCAADKGFLCGSTKSFFSPCGVGLMGCGGHGLFDFGKCRTPVYGTGPTGPWPHCTYDSYLNH